jgi:hypothetical protein
MSSLAVPISDKSLTHASLNAAQMGEGPNRADHSSTAKRAVLLGDVQPTVQQKAPSSPHLACMRQNTFDLSLELDALMSLPISTTAMLQAKSQDWSRSPTASATQDLAPLNHLWDGGASSEKIDYLIGLFSHSVAHSSPESQVSLHMLSRYLKKQMHHPQTHLLLSELSSFFHLIMQSKSTELVRNTLAIFPPKTSQDFKCVDGTRARLMDALTFFQRESGYQQGVEGELQAKLASGLDEIAHKVYITEKLGKQVKKEFDIHLIPYLNHLAGISQNKILQKDGNAALPARFFTAQEAGRISHLLRNTQSGALQQAKSIIQSQMEDFFQAVSKNDFSGSNFHDVTNHSLVHLLQRYQPDFDIASEKYLSENTETGDYAWNTQALFNDIKIILKNNLLSDHITPALQYKENYSSQDISEITTALLSPEVNQKEQALHLLSLLSDNLKGNSPAIFVHILIQAAQKMRGDTVAPLTDSEKTQDVFQLLASLKNEVKIQPYLSEKLNDIEAEWVKIAGFSDVLSTEMKAYWNEQHKDPTAIFSKSRRKSLDDKITSKLHPLNYVFMSSFIYAPTFFLDKIHDDDQEKQKSKNKVHRPHHAV